MRSSAPSAMQRAAWLASFSVGCAAAARPPEAAEAQATSAVAPAEPAGSEALTNPSRPVAQAPAVLALDAVTPFALPGPPFERTLLSATRPSPPAPAPELVLLQSVAADPVRSLEQPAYRADAPYFLAPVADGALPEGARADIPTHYQGEGLRALIPSGEYLLLVYGGRYLAVTRAAEVVKVLDLEAFRHAPRVNSKWAEFAVQDVTYAQLVDGTLYVCNGGGSYAREVYGKKGFISALDLQAGTLRWRSDALVCNSSFAVAGDYLITGYGFTAEPDFVFVLRLADGEALRKTRVASGPDTIELSGKRVRVETYDHSYDFELR